MCLQALKFYTVEPQYSGHSVRQSPHNYNHYTVIPGPYVTSFSEVPLYIMCTYVYNYVCYNVVLLCFIGPEA